MRHRMYGCVEIKGPLGTGDIEKLQRPCLRGGVWFIVEDWEMDALVEMEWRDHLGEKFGMQVQGDFVEDSKG